MNPLLQQRIDWCVKKGVRIGQNRLELNAAFMEIDNIAGSTILEIGSMAGGNLYCLAGALHFPPFTVVAVDDATWHDSDLYAKKLDGVMETLKKDGFTSVAYSANSHAKDTLRWTKAYLGGRAVDVLYIDGDHSYEGCKQDAVMYSPLVRLGGLIMFHDIASPEQPGVRKVWEEIRRAGHWTRGYVGEPDDLAGKKKRNITGVGFVRKDREIVL